MGAVLGPALLTLSLLSKEEGIATVAYLVAFAIVLDEASWPRRILALAPYAIVIIAWRLCWSYLGYGVCAPGPYVDPLREPLRFAPSFLNNAPILLLGQFAAPPADVSLLLDPVMRRWLCAGAWVFVALIVAAWLPLLRRDRVARFWALGMLLALIPLCTTFPADRMLLFVGVGAMGLMVQFLLWLLADPAGWPRWHQWRAVVIVLAGVFVVRHAVVRR